MIIKRKSTFMVGIILFIAALIITSASSILYSSDESIENRSLAAMPDLPSDITSLRAFPLLFESYFRDHIVLRAELIKLYANFLFFIGVSPVEKVILGKDDWLFYNGGRVVQDYQNTELFSESELKIWAESLQIRQDLLKAKGIGYLFIIAPNKHTIYSEYLPEYLGKRGDKSRLDQLFSYLHEHTKVNFLDLRPILLANKSAENILYWSQDSHWNRTGAYFGQLAIQHKLKEMGYDIPNSIAEPGRWQGEYLRSLDLANMLGVNESSETKHKSYQKNLLPCLDSISISDAWKSDRLAGITNVIKTKCPSRQVNALVFRDSYSTELVPFFSDYFKEATYVWTLPSEDVFKYFIEPNVDIVIEERVERSLRLLPQPAAWTMATEQFDNKKLALDSNFDQDGILIFNLDADIAKQAKIYNASAIDYAPFTLSSLQWNSQVFFPKISFKTNKEYLVKLELSATDKGTTELFFQTAEIPKFHAVQKIIRKTVAGRNTLYFKLLNIKENSPLRIDPKSKHGQYIVHSLQVKEI